MQEINKEAERRDMRLKITTIPDLNEAQRKELQSLGCEAQPFLSWPHALLFSATCIKEQEQALRSLNYVTEVGPMPVYRPC